MRFLFDAQLPPALARSLEERGHEAAHVATIGMVDASDAAIAAWAEASAAVLVSKDEDFVTLAPAGSLLAAVAQVRQCDEPGAGGLAGAALG